jgi:hypothetical protein
MSHDPAIKNQISRCFLPCDLPGNERRRRGLGQVLKYIIRAAFSVLGRMSFITVGEDEVEALVIQWRPKRLKLPAPFTTILNDVLLKPK